MDAEMTRRVSTGRTKVTHREFTGCAQLLAPFPEHIPSLVRLVGQIGRIRPSALLATSQSADLVSSRQKITTDLSTIPDKTVRHDFVGLSVLCTVSTDSTNVFSKERERDPDPDQMEQEETPCE